MANQGFNAFVAGVAANVALVGSELLVIIKGGASQNTTVNVLRALGTILNYAPAAGALNNVNPGGAFPLDGSGNAVGRLNVDTTAGNTEWTGLVAGTDGIPVLITNLGPNNLQLDNANAGSTAANRFAASGNLVIVPGGRTLAVYDGGRSVWSVG